MDVRVALQGLAPGVENAEKADLRTEASWIGGNLQQRCRTGIEQESEEKFFVLPHQWHQQVAEKLLLCIGERQLREFQAQCVARRVSS